MINEAFTLLKESLTVPQIPNAWLFFFPRCRPLGKMYQIVVQTAERSLFFLLSLEFFRCFKIVGGPDFLESDK